MIYDGWWDPQLLPGREEFGVLYPWRTVRAHAASRALARRVDQARWILDALGDLDEWVASLSAGKDSTALALLLPPGTRAASIRDGLCWPGEDLYLDALTSRCRLPLERVHVQADLISLARRTPGALLLDQEDRAGPLSGPWFDAATRIIGHRLWGLRADESRGRALNRATHGHTYQRRDGVRVCAPLSDWSSLDVHAFLAGRGIPPHPVYLCVDPGADPLRIRHAWWIAGGGLARYGHYTWLRRWWPDLWDLAVEIDPALADVV